MASTRKSLFIALALLAGGVLAFFAFLYVRGIDPDEQRLGVLEWVVGGMLIAPGFGQLIKWRKLRDAERGKT